MPHISDERDVVVRASRWRNGRKPQAAALEAHNAGELDGIDFLPGLLKREHFPEDNSKAVEIRRLVELLSPSPA